MYKPVWRSVCSLGDVERMAVQGDASRSAGQPLQQHQSSSEL